MSNFAVAAGAAGGLAALTIGLAAPALAAPSGSASAQDTVNSLEAAGYAVILNKVGHAPLEQCTVTAVRPGQEITQRVTDSTDSGNRSVEKVVHKTVFVDASC
jgi:hypothetical protein